MSNILGAASASTDAPPAVKPRDPVLDNAKFAAILLVVVGHAWTDLRDVWPVEAAYMFVYAFHVPVFVLLAGYVSKSSLTPYKALKTGAALLGSYLVFEYLYESLQGWAGDYDVNHNPMAPSWVMWFLAALLMWRLSAPLWRRLPAWLGIGSAVAISLLGGLSSEDDYAVAKTLSLLPFFVIGLHLHQAHLDAVRSPRVRRWALALMASVAVVCLVVASRFDIGWLRWRYSYAELGVSTPVGMLLRLAVIVAALALAAAFVTLVSSRRTWRTEWGTRTMYAYLLHGVFIQLAVVVGVFGWGWVNTLPGAVLVTAAAVGVAVLLLAPPVGVVFGPLIEPAAWMFAPAPPPTIEGALNLGTVPTSPAGSMVLQDHHNSTEGLNGFDFGR